MAMGVARKLAGGVLGLVAAGARHAVWYVRYQLDGATRDQPPGRDRDAG
jgi:hypothetical protein